MIRILGSFRKGDGSGNKIKAYILYALGEIVLVVIGILIALSINNANEASKTKTKIEQILADVQRDLILHADEANFQFDAHIYNDSIQEIILNGEYTREDYKTGEAIELGKYYSSFTLSTDSFDNLMLNRADLENEYADLAEYLSFVYVHSKSYIDDYNKRLKETVYQYLDERYYQPWSQNWVKGIKDDRAIDYFMNNPEYKSYLLKFMNDANNLTIGVNRFRFDASQLYLSIDSLLGKQSELPVELNYRATEEEKEALVGRYSLTYADGSLLPDYIEIRNVNNSLLLFNPEFGEVPFLKHRGTTYFIPFDGSVFEHDGAKTLSITSNIEGSAIYVKD